MEIAVRSLEQEILDELFSAFYSGFSDYEIDISKEELRLMLVRRSFDLSDDIGTLFLK